VDLIRAVQGTDGSSMVGFDVSTITKRAPLVLKLNIGSHWWLLLSVISRGFSVAMVGSCNPALN